jgi:DNA primase
MRKTIPKSFIQELVSRIDIVDIVKSRIQFSKESPNNCSAICPFHREKTPSFTVSRIKQFYFCFGCGTHGNVINFVMQFDRLDFIQAVECLAQYAGMPVPYIENQVSHEQSNVNKMYICLKNAAEFYQKILQTHATIIQYLKSRGVTGKTAKYFCLGAAPHAWHRLYEQFKQKKNY